MRVVFRVDASVEVGVGHLMRCLAFAVVLRDRGASALFLIGKSSEKFTEMIAAEHFDFVVLESSLALEDLNGEVCNAGSGQSEWERDLAEVRATFDWADWLIVDNYRLDCRWESGMSDRVGQILVIDDLANRSHTGSFLLDQNLGRRDSDYEGLVPHYCQRLIGPNFALIRPQFSQFRDGSLSRRAGAEVKHILVSLGGTDPQGITSRVLLALSKAELSPCTRISVVLKSQAPGLKEVEKIASSMPWPTLVYTDVKDMAAFLSECDLCIGAGGITAWERCCLGLPSILVKTAENQASGINALLHAGAALSAGHYADRDFSSRLVKLLGASQGTLSGVAVRAAGVCDGLGAYRLTDILINARLNIRPANPDDARAVWLWRNHSRGSELYLNPVATPLSDHLQWFSNALRDDRRTLLILDINGVAMAHLRLDQGEGEEAAISIVLNPDVRGRGLACKAILAALASPYARNFNSFRALVHQNNLASLKAFLRAGFEAAGQQAEFFILQRAKPC